MFKVHSIMQLFQMLYETLAALSVLAKCRPSEYLRLLAAVIVISHSSRAAKLVWIRDEIPSQKRVDAETPNH